MSDFDRRDFAARYGTRASRPSRPSSRSPRSIVAWPVAPATILRTGDTTTENRDGKGRPHRGLDIFAESGTVVSAAQAGRVLRVQDGRVAESESARRAGLWIDILGTDGRVYRYLHLGDSKVSAGHPVRQGQAIGTIAAAFTSGLRDAPHLHFEIRSSDYDRKTRDYGMAIDPLSVLPPLAA